MLTVESVSRDTGNASVEHTGSDMMVYAFDPANDDCLLDELDKVGWVVHHTGQSVRIDGPDGWNVADNSFRILYLVRGEQEWELRNVGVLSQRAGQVLVVTPGQHYRVSNARASANEVFWLGVCMAGRKGLPGMSRETASKLRDQLRVLSNQPVSVREGIRTCFETILSAYRRKQTFASVKARASLHHLLLYVVEGQSVGSGAAQGISAPIAKVMDYVQENVVEGPSLEEMARLVGLSVPHFRKRFAEEVGITPARYLANLRVEAAKELLRGSNNSIAVIASAVGMSSGQNFATFFRRHTGFTPAEFRKRGE